METARIASLLAPYLEDEALEQTRLHSISTYIDLLLKWNARMNLTSVRDPEQIATRHFGESLFAARHIFPDPSAGGTLADIGSGAGFPGLPIALIRPQLSVKLIEGQTRKATFLKEVVRALALKNVTVFSGRAESLDEKSDVVTFRAVERFEAVLPVAASLVSTGGRLAALVGESQVDAVKGLSGSGWSSAEPVYLPGSSQRVLQIVQRQS